MLRNEPGIYQDGYKSRIHVYRNGDNWMVRVVRYDGTLAEEVSWPEESLFSSLSQHQWTRIGDTNYGRNRRLHAEKKQQA